MIDKQAAFRQGFIEKLAACGLQEHEAEFVYNDFVKEAEGMDWGALLKDPKILMGLMGLLGGGGLGYGMGGGGGGLLGGLGGGALGYFLPQILEYFTKGQGGGAAAPEAPAYDEAGTGIVPPGGDMIPKSSTTPLDAPAAPAAAPAAPVVAPPLPPPPPIVDQAMSKPTTEDILRMVEEGKNMPPAPAPVSVGVAGPRGQPGPVKPAPASSVNAGQIPQSYLDAYIKQNPGLTPQALQAQYNRTGTLPGGFVMPSTPKPGVIQSAWNAAKEAPGVVADTPGNLVETAGQAYGGLRNAQDTAGDVLNAGYQGAKAIPGKAGEVLNEGWQGAKALPGKAGEVLNEGWQGAKRIPGQVYNAGEQAANAALDVGQGIDETATAAGQAINKNVIAPTVNRFNKGYSNVRR